MKKLPDITMQDWLSAEEELRITKITPRPEGITVDEYAKERGTSLVNARRILREIFQAGLATRKRWCNGTQSGVFVYQLKRKDTK